MDQASYHSISILLDLIEKFDQNGYFNTIIDIGSGTGGLTRLLASKFDQFNQIYGIDIDPKMIDLAENISKSDIIQYVLTDLSRDWSSMAEPIRKLESKVSLVFSHSAIHHIRQKLVFANNLRRLMATGARAYICYFVLYNPTLKLTGDLKATFGQYIEIPTDKQQIQLWSQLFEANGFIIEYQVIDNTPIHVDLISLFDKIQFYELFLKNSLKNGIIWEELSDEIRDNLLTLLLDSLINTHLNSIDWKIIDRLKNGTYGKSVQLNQPSVFIVCKAN